MTTLGVIPARYASSRFPGKALALIAGKPMIQWVYEGASKACSLDDLIVATDDERICRAVRRFGGTAVITSDRHPSGTDRVAEAAKETSAELVVNIQGDEPLISGAVVDEAVRLLMEAPAFDVATLVSPITDAEDLVNPAVAKVVVSRDSRALYFSRSPIPHARGLEPSQWLRHHPYWKHVGLYVFRRDFLLEFVTWPVSALERVERLEQLRILENGHSIKVGYTDFVSRPVDTPEDLERIRELVPRR